MEYTVFAACHCLGQACCWYNVFRWCGLIDARRHVQIDKQIVIIHTPALPTVDPNPFKTQPDVNPFMGTS